jgi:hypothetical protein
LVFYLCNCVGGVSSKWVQIVLAIFLKIRLRS